MKDTGQVTEKLTLIFFDILEGFHRFSMNIRIEVHFLSFGFGKERTLVSCKSFRNASRFTRFTRDQCPFISPKKCIFPKKGVLQSLNAFNT